jgi:hypothetical protein
MPRPKNTDNGEKFFSKSWAAGVSASINDLTDGFGLHITCRH